MLKRGILCAAVGAILLVASHEAAGRRIDTEQAMGEMHDAEREIHELHAFFQAWFHGSIANTDVGFARLTEALSDRFTFVAPSGDSLSREQILNAVRQSHTRDADARVWVENVRLLHESDSTVAVRYDEWQTLDGETRSRVSTVVFLRDPDGPNGLRWLTVHETWLPEE